MKIITSTAVVALLTITACAAPEEAAAAGLSGDVELTFAETTAGKWAAAKSFGLQVDATEFVTAGIELDMDAAGAVSMDEWNAGFDTGVAAVSIGKQGNVWVDGPSAAAHSTLLDPATGESIQVSAGGVAVQVEIEDMTTDITDIGSIQGSYTMDVSIVSTTVAANYDTTSEKMTLGGRGQAEYSGAILGSTVTWSDAADWAYEADATVFGITGYLNGDKSDSFQNIGGTVTNSIADGLTIESSVNYNLDNESLSPQIQMSFAF